MYGKKCNSKYYVNVMCGKKFRIMMEFGAFLKTFEGMRGLLPYFLTQKFVKNDKKY